MPVRPMWDHESARAALRDVFGDRPRYQVFQDAACLPREHGIFHTQGQVDEAFEATARQGRPGRGRTVHPDAARACRSCPVATRDACLLEGLADAIASPHPPAMIRAGLLPVELLRFARESLPAVG